LNVRIFIVRNYYIQFTVKSLILKYILVIISTIF